MLALDYSSRLFGSPGDSTLYRHHNLPVVELRVQYHASSRSRAQLLADDIFFLSCDMNWQAALWLLSEPEAPLRVINFGEVGARSWLLTQSGYASLASELPNLALFVLTE